MDRRSSGGSLFATRDASLSGVRILEPRLLDDSRGRLQKIIHSGAFTELGLPAAFEELFVTWSAPKVVRGLHFQTPPSDQGKLVTCLTGAVFDVVVDIRRGSPTYGRHDHLELDARRGTIVFIPPGFAHGFAVVGDGALMLYATTVAFDPSCDAGVRWNSAGVEWPYAQPVLSPRDRALPPLADFVSPFPHKADEV